MTSKQLAARLEALAEHMLDVATEMEYYGGFDPAAALHAKELAGAAGIARNWAENIRLAPKDQSHEDQSTA